MVDLWHNVSVIVVVSYDAFGLWKMDCPFQEWCRCRKLTFMMLMDKVLLEVHSSCIEKMAYGMSQINLWHSAYTKCKSNYIMIYNIIALSSTFVFKLSCPGVLVIVPESISAVTATVTWAAQWLPPIEEQHRGIPWRMYSSTGCQIGNFAMNFFVWDIFIQFSRDKFQCSPNTSWMEVVQYLDTQVRNLFEKCRHFTLIEPRNLYGNTFSVYYTLVTLIFKCNLLTNLLCYGEQECTIFRNALTLIEQT